MTEVYDPGLRAAARAAASRLGIGLAEGVYAAMQGPSYETPAEVRMLRGLGADAVGMSTVPEAIAARHAGMRVLAFSMISNLAAGLSDRPLSHEEVLATGAEAGKRLGRLIEEVAGGLCR
jgi:purine-nucleoside phosphorylase